MKLSSMWRRGSCPSRAWRWWQRPCAAVVAAQDDDNQVVVMTYFGAELGEAALKDLLAAWEQESGNTVQFVPVGHEDYKTGILIQLAGGNPPDMHSIWAGARTQFQVDNDMLAPLDEMWAANDLDSQFGAGMIESAATYNGHKYLLPFGYHIAPIFYNPKVFADNRIESPRRGRLQGHLWNTERGGVLPISMGSVNRWPAQFWFDYILLRTAGPEYPAKLMAGEASYTDPEVVRTLELWGELMDAGCFPDGATANSLDWTDAADQLIAGDAAMNLMGTWFTGYVDGNGAVPVEDYDFFQFPVIDEGVPSAVVGPVDGLATAAGGKHTAAAQDLLAFLAQPDSQTAWAIGQGALAPNVNADTSQFTPVMAKAVQVAAAAETFNFNYDLATPPAPSEVGLDMFQQFINDPSDIEGLLARTQDGVAAAFENQ